MQGQLKPLQDCKSIKKEPRTGLFSYYSVLVGPCLVVTDYRDVVVQVQKQGVYVLSAKVQDADSRVDVTFDACACMTERELVPGLVNAAAAAYRLEPGCHRLAVHVQSRTASRVSVSLR